MHDIKELEERWKKYRRRRLLPYVLFGLIVIAGAVTFSLLPKRNYMHLIKDAFAYPTTSKQSDKNRSIPTKTKQILVSKPSDAIYVSNDANDTLAKDRVVRTKSPLETNVVPESETVSSKNNFHIEVIGTKNQKNVYKMIEKRFKLSHDPEDGLFLARYYMKKGDYKKAEYWALQTNKIDSSIEESWLIFAQAKARSGKKQEALIVLREYLKRHRSAKAKKLFDRLNR